MLNKSDSIIPDMPHPAILDPNQTYNFGQFFELNADPEELFAEFGVRLENQNLTLPRSPQTPPFPATLETRINRRLQLTTNQSAISAKSTINYYIRLYLAVYAT